MVNAGAKQIPMHKAVAQADNNIGMAMVAVHRSRASTSQVSAMAEKRFSSFFQDLFGAKAGRTHSRTRSSARQNTGEMNANVNIDLYTALLGGEVIIQLGNGSKIKLKVKPETQNGTKVRLRGKGYDRGDGTMGDLIITYNVKLPTNLSERQKQLLKEMQQS